MLFPAIWVLWAQDVAVGVMVHRWTIGWARWRFQLDWGRWQRADINAPIEWSTSGLDGFLAWGRNVFEQKWGKEDIDHLFKVRPEWKRLVALGGAHPHYIRLLLAREIFEERRSAIQPEEGGLSALEAALDINQTEDASDDTWTISQRDSEQSQASGTVLPPKPYLDD